MQNNKNLAGNLRRRPKEQRIEYNAFEKICATHTAADPLKGLTAEQVTERINAGYVNKAAVPPGKSVLQIIAGNVFTYFNLIFFVLAGCLIAVGSYRHLLFLIVVFSNTVIAVVQELNAKRTLDKLSLIAMPHSTVIRDGAEIIVPSDTLVVDDTVIFTAGNQICADAVMISGEAQVNEAFITGESDEITKHPGDRLLSGSFVTSGKCCARLEKVGDESFVSQLTINAKKLRHKMRPGMMKSLTRLIQVIGILLIPLGTAMYYKERVFLNLSVKEAVESSTAALIGMIPEGLYLLTTVALAVSVVRLAKKNTLVHNLGCIETLARTDVLCVDKTGTITENNVKLTEIVPLSEGDIDGLMRDFAGNMEPDNATMRAIKDYYRPSEDQRPRTAQKTVFFSSSTKYSAVSFENEENYVLGAPEFIMRDEYSAYRAEVEKYSEKGMRVLLFAEYAGTFDKPNLTASVKPIALLLFINEIRREAPATFDFFIKQGVEVKVISGDNPVTVSAAAAKAGIPNSDRYIDVSSLTNDNDNEIKLNNAALTYTIFGRVSPEQKRILIRSLKKAGHTVAMTGDGVNDVLALKEADCGIAMASGSDAACQISHLVLLDSNFASLPAVVAEGRRVINNIERSAALFLVKNIFSFFLAVISIFALFSYPIAPAQLSLVGAFTIGIPSFFLALQPNNNIVKGRFLRNVLYRAFPSGLTDLFVIIGVVLFNYAFKMDENETSTITALLIGVIGLITLRRVCMPFNLFRGAIWAGMTISFIIAAIAAGGFFTLVPLSLGGALILTSLAIASIPVMNLFGKIFETASKLLKRFIKKTDGGK